MKYLKELLKEKKYVPVIIAVLVVTEAFKKQDGCPCRRLYSAEYQ